MTDQPNHLAAAPIWPVDPFSEILELVHVRGERAAKVSSRRPVTIEFPKGRPCLHFVEQGDIAVRVGDDRPTQVGAGKLALVLYDGPHWVDVHGGGRPEPPGRAQEIAPEGAANPQDGEVRLFWGSFSFDGELAGRILKPLPKLIILTDLDRRPIELLQPVLRLILLETQSSLPGASVMVSRLLDLLLIQVLRRWAETSKDVPAWLATMRDQRIARAVAAIHREPSGNWTNDRLAEEAGMSRSSFVERFGLAMGQPPGAYLRAWRLDRAAEALVHTGETIDRIAASFGYSSQEAFSRAFQVRFGVSPSSWRMKQRP
ncbi:MAG: AraC family transcriptional regulator [Paracoccaceae bacterium]